MVALVSYLGRRVADRIFEFLEHWYWGSFHFVGGFLVNTLERWDRFFALKVTIRYWLQPLYQDRTFIGYILGPIFRTGRIIIGALVYLVAIVAALFLYFIWLMIPPYIIYKIVIGF